MTENQMAVCRALADNDLNISAAARALYRSHSTVYRTVDSIRRNTGLNPMSFNDLHKLISGDYEPTIPMFCRVCGKQFMGRNRRFKLCSDECRATAVRISIEKRYARERAARDEAREADRKFRLEMQKKPRPIRIVSDPSLSIAEVNAKAKAAGLSYGQYVARCMR